MIDQSELARTAPGRIQASPRVWAALLIVYLFWGSTYLAIRILVALIISAVPLWLVVFRAVTGDRPALATVAGVLAGFAGLALLGFTQGGTAAPALSVVIALAAALCWASGSFWAGRLPMPRDFMVSAVYEMLSGGLVLLAAAAIHGDLHRLGHVTGQSWLAFGYLVSFGSLVAFTAYGWLLTHARISLVGTYAYVNPAVAVAAGAVVLGEQVTWQILLGGVIAIGGVALIIATETRRLAAAAPRVSGRCCGSPVR